MKSTIVVVLLILSLVANAVLWHRVDVLEKASPPKDASADYPLGEMMGYLQRYADKLWYAGTAGNWELADFYQGEIGETADDIIKAGVSKDGVPVSKSMQAILPPAVSALGQAVAAKDAAQFRARYTAMVQSCNECHETSKHAFIHVAVPGGAPTYWNQKFAP